MARLSASLAFVHSHSAYEADCTTVAYIIVSSYPVFGILNTMANHVLDNEADKLENGTINSEQQLRNVLTNTMSISPELFVSL